MISLLLYIIQNFTKFQPETLIRVSNAICKEIGASGKKRTSNTFLEFLLIPCLPNFKQASLIQQSYC